MRLVGSTLYQTDWSRELYPDHQVVDSNSKVMIAVLMDGLMMAHCRHSLSGFR